MDYRALAELVWFSLLGLSVLALVAGVSVRVFLAPVVRQILEGLGERRTEEQARLAARLELLESRVDEMDSDLRHLDAADDFYRRLHDGEEDEEDTRN